MDYFDKAADAAVSMQKKGTGMFGNLVMFVSEKAETHCVVHKDDLAAMFKEREAIYQKEHKNAPSLGSVGAYRSAKSVLLSAVEYSIPIKEINGKPRGKTDIEKDIKDAKAPKPDIEKFYTAMSTASNVADKLHTHTDIGLAFTATKALADKLAKAYEAAAPKVA